MVFTLVLVFGAPLVIAHTRRLWRRGQAMPASADTDQRLERIEHAIDAMAVEIERIAEGQRFVTRLLSERAPEHAALPPSRQR
jgi:hypothetical protein